MFKYPAITMALLALGLIFSPTVAGDTPTYPDSNVVSNGERESLEVEKLRLEIQKIQNETHTATLQPLLQLGTLLAALIAASISLWSAWKAQRSQLATLTAQIKQQQQARISDLLKELGSEQLAVRISAIQALSEYKSAAPFLVNVLRVDNEPRVLSATLTALQTMPDVSLPLLCELTTSLHEQHLNLAGELLYLGLMKEDICKLMSIDISVFEASLRDVRLNRVQESAKLKLLLFREIGKGTEEEIQKLERQRILNDWISIRSTIEASLRVVERVIEYAAKSGATLKLEKAYLEGINLDGLNLSGWSFESANIHNASLRDCICSMYMTKVE